MSKSSTISLPNSIKAGISPTDLVTALLSLSTNVSWSSILDAVNRLPAGYNTELIGAVCLFASMNVKAVADEVIKAVGAVIPDEWKVGNTVNFSMLAMCGHLIFLLDDSDLGPDSITARKAYIASLGGKKDLIEFGSAGSVVGKPERTKILKEWASRVEGADKKRIKSVLSKKFPKLVKPESSLPDPTAPIFYLIRLFFYIIWIPFGITLAVLRFLFTGRMVYLTLTLLYWVPYARNNAFMVTEFAVSRSGSFVGAYAWKISPEWAKEGYEEATEVLVEKVFPRIPDWIVSSHRFSKDSYKAWKSANLTFVYDVGVYAWDEVLASLSSASESDGGVNETEAGTYEVIEEVEVRDIGISATLESDETKDTKRGLDDEEGIGKIIGKAEEEVRERGFSEEDRVQREDEDFWEKASEL